MGDTAVVTRAATISQLMMMGEAAPNIADKHVYINNQITSLTAMRVAPPAKLAQ